MLEKKGQMEIVAGVIAIVVGIAMLPIFSSLIDDAQEIKTSNDEIVTTTVFNTTVTLINPKIIEGTMTIVNASLFGVDATANLSTLRDNFEFAVNEKDGKVTLLNRTGTFNASYDYKPTTYVNTATGRTVVKQITLFFAVSLILLTLAVVGIRMSRS